MNNTYNFQNTRESLICTAPMNQRMEAESNPGKRGYLYNASPGRILPNRTSQNQSNLIYQQHIAAYDTLNQAFGGRHGILLMDGKKKYYDRVSAASEIDRKKNELCDLYEKVQRMQMHRFIEKINEIKEETR